MPVASAAWTMFPASTWRMPTRPSIGRDHGGEAELGASRCRSAPDPAPPAPRAGRPWRAACRIAGRRCRRWRRASGSGRGRRGRWRGWPGPGAACRWPGRASPDRLRGSILASTSPAFTSCPSLEQHLLERAIDLGLDGDGGRGLGGAQTRPGRSARPAWWRRRPRRGWCRAGWLRRAVAAVVAACGPNHHQTPPPTAASRSNQTIRRRIGGSSATVGLTARRGRWCWEARLSSARLPSRRRAPCRGRAAPGTAPGGLARDCRGR